MGRCELDPGLKAPLVSKFQPNEDKLAFKLNLVSELAPLHSGGRTEQKPAPPRLVLSPEVPEEEAWKSLVLLMDKPKTWTSFDVVGKVRGLARKMGVKKAGRESKAQTYASNTQGGGGGKFDNRLQGPESVKHLSTSSTQRVAET